jgi:LuxR family maltose regulon positive regulatory protein
LIPLLATKLIIPPQGKIRVDRPHLLQSLDECLQPGCRLLLISAPAGFGKTTLLSAWIAGFKVSQRQPTPSVCWLALDQGDNDPVVFWSDVISSLQTQLPEIGKQSLHLLQTTQAPDLQVRLGALINDLAQNPNPLVLILDDFHLVRNPGIHHTLAFLLEHMASQSHVILASRTDPPLPLSLLRGRGQMLEIRQNDLRFSDEDADSYLNRGLGLNLPIQAIKALNQKTEGWIAGLQMAALSLHEAAATRNRERIESFIASFSGSDRYIMDYLIDEVLDQQSPEIQDFLLKTSILDRVCSPLCDALLASNEKGISPEPQKILEYLESNNLFIVPLDNQRYWYRYHFLFAELLRKRLSQVDPDIVPGLHQRATDWYEHNGLIAKAVEHALLSGNVQKAAALISQICEELWGRGEHVTLLNWIGALPEEERRRHPELWIWQASMLITAGEMHEAERHVAKLEEYLRSLPTELDQCSLRGQIYSLRTYIASFHGDIPSLLHYAHLALNTFSEDEGAFGRCGLLLVLGGAYLSNGDLEAASNALAEAIEIGEIAPRPYMVTTAMANLAIAHYAQGQLNRASHTCQEGLLQIERYGLDRSPLASNLLATQGLILCERNDLEPAEGHILRGLELARERDYVWSQAWGYRALIRLLLAQNNLPAAEAALKEAEQLTTRHEIPEYHSCGISGLRVRAWIRQGKLEQAEGYLRSRDIRVDGDIQYPHETEYWALASLCLARGDRQSAGNLLQRMLKRSETAKLWLWTIRCSVLQSLLYREMDSRRRSIQSLSRALELAEREGCIQTFLDEGEPMRHLLSEAFEQNIHPEYVYHLLQSFCEEGAEDKHPHGRLAQPGEGLLPGRLTVREREIIRLIAEGYTNKEIAQRLYISLRTVKYYATNIYRKLEVHGRAAAAVRAKELGLLKQ